MVRRVQTTCSPPAQLNTLFRCTILCMSSARAHALMRYKVSRLPGDNLGVICLAVQGECKDDQDKVATRLNVRGLWNYRKVDV